MKKIKYSLLIAIICFFVMPSVISAACGLAPWPEYVVSIGGGVTTAETLMRGYTYEFHALVRSNTICANVYSEYGFSFDDEIFEFEGFESNYGFKYDNGKIILSNKNKLNIKNAEFEKEEGYYNANYHISTESPGVVSLYTIVLKVKETAKLGETDGYLKKYKIICNSAEMGAPYCNEDNNDNNNGENQKPNNSTQEENSNNEIKDENNNNNNNNNIVPKPDNDQNNDDIENDNKEGNNVTNKVILDDTKFYILASLLGVVVIEMFVLILNKTKK